MSTLFLVRHGQASFLSSDYDRLSPAGEEQAKKLGLWLAKTGQRIDSVFTGPRVRQRRTAEIAGETYAASNVGAYPDPVLVPELDEYQAEDLLKRYLADVRHDDPLAGHVRAFHEAIEFRERVRHADRLLGALLRRWVDGEVVTEGIETFAEFRARVARALDTVTATGGGRTVLAFTSGGFIGAAVANVLRADDHAAVDLGLMCHNAAYAEIVWTGARRSLRHFNAKPHLDDPGAWTHR
jgi:broad specificity phosphatase PhoE